MEPPAGADVNVTLANRSADRRRAGLVAFLFGVSRTERLPGVALTTLLEDLELGRAAARGQLARMRRAGALVSHPRGREVDYALAGTYAEQFRRLRNPPPVPVWAGHFHALLYQVPLEQRAYRERLRRGAQLAGYGLLQHGVLIAAIDRTAEIAKEIAEAPLDCRLRTVTVGMSVAEAAEAAAHAWDLEGFSARIRGHVETLTASLATVDEPPPSAATLRRLADLRNAPLVDLLDEPRLPPELLPADWPVPELAALQVEVLRRYAPPAATYVHGVIARCRG